MYVTCASSEGGQGFRTPPPPENHKNIWYRSNTVPEKSQSYQASIQCWAIIGTPAKRHLNGVSLAGRRWSADSGIWILSSLPKNISIGSPLTKLCACVIHVHVLLRLSIFSRIGFLYLKKTHHIFPKKWLG